MAVDEVNQAGGIHGRALRLQLEDDEESVNTGRLVAQRLGQDPDVVAVIGHLQSYVTVPAAAIYDLAGLVLLSPVATSEELTARGYTRVFRGNIRDRVTGVQMADYAVSQRFGNVAIYYERSIYGRALANAFEERMAASASTVVARDSFDPDQSVGEGVLGPMLSRWQQLDVDALFIAGQLPLAGQIIVGLRSAGFEQPILGGDAMSSPALISIAGDAAEGTVVASFFHPEEPDPEVRRFVDAFSERFGFLPDVASALGYDAVKVLSHGMNQAESPAPEHVAPMLHQVKDWKGVTGSFTFDERGDLVGREVARCIVRDGEFRYLGETAVNDGS
jgi:branched-chain amino acid transport system substrate-binding protein